MVRTNAFAKPAAMVLMGALLFSGAACSAENKGPQVSPTIIAKPNSSESGTGTGEATPPENTAPGTAAPTSSWTAGEPPSSTPFPSSTSLTWKTYTDPAKTVSFELPGDWIAQSVTPEAGSMPGAVKVEVKDATGRYEATLQTGLAPAAPATCPDGGSTPYVVIDSAPVDLPHAEGPGSIAPRVVFRVLQGYRFFGSYGITNVVAGVDGRACELNNRVVGPEGKGDYSFGDVLSLRAFTTDEKVAPAKAFDTLDLAAKYAAHGSEFADVKRMLLSLKVNP